jgi:NADH-quinone oxidoreductase subunit M
MITLTVFLPALTAVLVLLVPKQSQAAARNTALFGSLATLGFAAALLVGFDPAATGFQFVEDHEWLPQLGVAYTVGVDGISLFLVLLSALLVPIAVLCSWRAVETRVREFHAALLLLETGMLGVFTALDLVLFYVYWEVMLIPMYLLIGVWGSRDRIQAAVKFLIYTMAGSLLMLLAILYVYFHLQSAGVKSFGLAEVYAGLKSHPLSSTAQFWCFLAFALSFAIKVPLFPFHTWLPDAHTEAPTAGSVVLAGVLLKMGGYGFLRFAIPFFPDAAAELAPWIALLSVVGIIFGALMCMVQDDMKRLIAYSSVSHMGFVMLGMFTYTGGDRVGVTGSLLQMLNHGISTGALFLLIGVIYERRHSRRIADYGGIAAVAPRLAAVFLITTLSSIGLPFLNGFAGEFLILQGTFRQSGVQAAWAGTGVVLGAAYMLVLYRRLFFGGLEDEENAKLSDLNLREIGFFLPLLALMVLVGLFSPWFTERMAASIEAWFRLLGK